MPDLSERLATVTGEIDAAARAAGRNPNDITTIVVTKFHSAELVRQLHALGVRDFGESRHQEAQPKVASLADLAATWHFVGQVQSKKARQVRGYIDVVHSVDRETLVDSLAGEPLEIFLQVNLTDDPQRGGAQPPEIPALAARAESAEGLRLLGLMAVAPLESDPAREFARVRELSERLQRDHPGAGALSMGMSGDFALAISEGATHLRIGTAITGNRAPHG